MKTMTVFFSTIQNVRGSAPAGEYITKQIIVLVQMNDMGG